MYLQLNSQKKSVVVTIYIKKGEWSKTGSEYGTYRTSLNAATPWEISRWQFTVPTGNSMGTTCQHCGYERHWEHFVSEYGAVLWPEIEICGVSFTGMSMLFYYK